MMPQENNEQQHPCKGREGWQLDGRYKGWYQLKDPTQARRDVNMNSEDYYGSTDLCINDDTEPLRWQAFATIRVADADEFLQVSEAWIHSQDPVETWLVAIEAVKERLSKRNKKVGRKRNKKVGQ